MLVWDRGDLLTDKENAGAALLDACKEVKTSDPVQIGSYRGYAISVVEFSAWKQEYTLLLKGRMTHRATLGTDPRGNLTLSTVPSPRCPSVWRRQRPSWITSISSRLPERRKSESHSFMKKNCETTGPSGGAGDFAQHRRKGQAHTEAVVAKSTRTSVPDSLKRPVTPRSTEKKPKQHEEVR